VTFLGLYLWPAIDKRLTKDFEEHHLLQRPRDHPMRTAFGVGVLTFYLVLFIGGGQDVIAQQIDWHIETVTWTLRAMALTLPIATAAISYKVCGDLREEMPLEEFARTGRPPVGPTDLPHGDDSLASGAQGVLTDGVPKK
jgi:ubiquinol-cytochrome c reductase cytochrome b subunit